MNKDELRDQINELIKGEIQENINEYVDSQEETKKAATLEVPVPELPPVRPVTNNLPNYDEMWGVSGYYNDNDGNDIRDRD